MPIISNRDSTRLGGSIEIGEAKAGRSVIVRDGKPVETPNVISEQVDFLITQLPGINRTDVARVISQNPEPGTFVKRGTRVNLVYAPPRRVPIGVFVGTLAELAERPITDVAPVLEDPLVHEMMTNYATPEDVPANVREQVSGIVASKLGVPVTEANFPQAFGTLQAGLAFK